jgi:hypothetical protein
MPYARNALDGRRVYFEDDGGDGTPVVLHGGIIDSVGLVRESNIAQALRTQRLPAGDSYEEIPGDRSLLSPGVPRIRSSRRS